MLTDKKLVAALDECCGKNGVCNPAIVIEKAKPANSPLHSQFEWDDKKAGHQYRLEQARTLIRRVKIEIEYNEESVRVVRLAHSPVVQGKGGYRRTTEIGQEDAADLLIDELKRLSGLFTRIVAIAVANRGHYPRGTALRLQQAQELVVRLLDRFRGKREKTRQSA